MQTLSHAPVTPPLSFFVELIWYSEAEIFNCRNLTLPMLNQELILNFSDLFEITADGQTVVSNARGWVSGLQTRPIQTITGGRHFTIGILLKPWGLYPFTGIAAEAFKDQSLALEDVFGETASQLAEDIFRSNHVQEVFQKMESFLMRHLRVLTLPAYLIQSLAILHASTLSDPAVEGLARKVGVSAKTLIGSFKKYLGVTPSQYHHLVVLNRLLQQLAGNRSQKLTATGYDLHFFDQAHFIHFFRRYTGLTPSAYIRQFAEGKITLASPHSIEMSGR